MGFEVSTPQFRIALSVCAVWLLVSLYMGYSSYKSVSSYEYTESYTEESARGSEDQLDLTSVDAIAYRSATQEEIESCLSLIGRLHRRFERDNKEQIIITALKWGLIPPFLLLLIVAAKTQLITISRMAADRYIKWIKGPDPQ